MRALVTVPSAAAATSASAATGTALSAGAPIYVQNPFTGEYLLAKVTTVAQGVVKQADAEDDATARGGSIL
jgi:DNA-binding response OmpR family regulator